jgi:hypothetical protein
MVLRDRNQTDRIAGLLFFCTFSQSRRNRFPHITQIICQHKTRPLLNQYNRNYTTLKHIRKTEFQQEKSGFRFP